MRYLINLVLAAVIISLFIQAGCSKSRVDFNTEVVHIADSFSPETFSGRSILFLPVYSDKGFDTASFNRPSLFVKKYLKHRKDLEFIYREEFESVFEDSCSPSEVTSFYNSLFRSKILEIKQKDCFWNNMPGKYLFLIKIAGGGRIKNFDRTVTRKIDLEGEMWDSDMREVVWRVSVSGNERNAVLTDREYIHKGITEILKKLPDFRFSNNEKEW